MSTPIFPPEKMDQLLESGEKLQERLRNMFDVAARIGHQQRAKEIACAREEGYEAGRQEGWRECQARPHSEASKASFCANSVSAVTETETHSPSPLSRSLCAVGTQTDTVTVPASPVPLNWAEDAEALPIPSPHPPLTPPTPRDFSALCTGISRLFARKYPAFPFTAPSNSFPPGPMPTQLDWDRDPRLRDLGRALAALGWVRP
ncbi:hypothetical protein B0H14DRAFT_2885285 [Mycena olivaceomarginata]|nr:hypothetical protein B0H14DRAFT_2885285 [Mycena olivaceomarginata]